MQALKQATRMMQLVSALFQNPMTWEELRARRYGPEQQEMPEGEMQQALAQLCCNRQVDMTTREGCGDTVYTLAEPR